MCFLHHPGFEGGEEWGNGGMVQGESYKEGELLSPNPPDDKGNLFSRYRHSCPALVSALITFTVNLRDEEMEMEINVISAVSPPPPLALKRTHRRNENAHSLTHNTNLQQSTPLRPSLRRSCRRVPAPKPKTAPKNASNTVGETVEFKRGVL